MRRSLKTGLVLGAITLAFEALAIFPGRYTLGRVAGQVGQSAVEVTIAGVLRDLSDVARPVGLAIGLVLGIALVVRMRRPIRLLLPALAVVALLLWFTSSAAAEFKVQRGVDATWLDVQIASRATGRGSTILGFLGCRRHWLPLLMSSALLAPLVMFVRRRVSWDTKNPLAVLGGFAGATILAWLFALVPLDPHVRVFSTISDRHVVGEPFVNLFAGFGRSQENVRLGMRGLIETATFAPDRASGGEALLGLPHVAPIDPNADIDCGVHPFARSFGEDGVEPQRLGAGGYHVLEPDAQRVLTLLDHLSAELYADRTKPIDVLQIMMESFRADDLHALEETAPRDLAPYVNGVYETAARGDGTVIAFRSMWQAGSRSSQGLSSYMCGLGTMPYGLSTTRDFGAVPLRCLTDVLADAKFDTAFWYGGNPSFDEMDPFFRRHGLKNIVGRQQLPRDAPVGQEGVTDRAVFADAADHILAGPGDHARYTLVMSATNHVPYPRPGDVPPALDLRVETLKADPAFSGGADDVARIRTFAYADYAVEELVGRLASRHDRTILVLGADHATGDPWAWSNPHRDVQAGQARIPFAIVLPEPLVANAAHPDAARDLVRQLDAAVDGRAWSQNDTPLFLLTLVSHAPGMRVLPREQRWHTLGGERTSPYFTALRPGVKIQGIDAMAGLFGEDDEGRSLLPAEKASFVTNPSELTTSSPSLTPVAAAMSTFLRGYAAKCGGPHHSKGHEPHHDAPPPITELEEEAP